jgi:DNA-binding NarL/FixJ family response regulator
MARADAARDGLPMKQRPGHLTELLNSRFRTLSELLSMSKRILVADDSDTVRRFVRSYLTQQDLDVCGEAVDGEDTIEKAWELKPDLILLDVAMPGTNGIIVASVLKDMIPNVQIVLFTMYSEAVHRTFTHKGLDVDAVIDKGEGMGKLADCVRGLLDS